MNNKWTYVLLYLAAIAWSSAANTQDFPSRPLILIVPWVAGGPTDVTIRTLAQATEKHLGQSIIIENRPGAAGTLAPMQMAATADPDGYTIAQIPVNVFRVPSMRKTSFDPIKDLSYIIHLTGDTYGIVVRKDSRWTTIGELLADAKAHPGTITYGSPGVGGGVHVGMEQIAKDQGIDWIHVPFNGSAEATNALLGGHIDVIGDPSTARPETNADKLRLLVTWGAHRTDGWPTVPTLKEIGINIVVNQPYGLAGPKGMDPKIVKILHDAFKKGMEEPLFTEMSARFDHEALYLDSAAYRQFAIQQMAEQKRVVEELRLNQE